MKNKKLSTALRDLAAALSESIESNATNLTALPDIAELLSVLARIVEGKTIDKAFGAPGDWGYGTPIGDGIFAMLKEPAEPVALEWNFRPELPDDEVRVLFAAGDEVETGHHEGDHWETTEGASYDESDVSAWAHLPAAPELPATKGGAK